MNNLKDMALLKKGFVTCIFVLTFSSFSIAQKAMHPELKAQYILSDVDLSRICTLDATDINAEFYISADELISGRAKRMKTADIQVDYVGSGWSAEAKNAFEYAVNIWEAYLDSDIPIRIEANWVELGERVLGSAGPTQIVQVNAGEPDTWYTISQGSAISGIDFVRESRGTANEVNHDIVVNISSNFPDWYFGTDAQTPDGKIDMVTVMLHEVGHGIGFSGSVRVSTGGSTAQWGYGFPASPIIYDRFVVDGNGNEILDRNVYSNNSGSLYDAVTGGRGGIYSVGINTIIANRGQGARLYAPSEWNGGSSFSHLDQTTFSKTENALMRPRIDRAFAIHSPGPVMCGILNDTGWPLTNACDDAINTSSFLTVDQPELTFGVVNEDDRIEKDITLTNPVDSPGFFVGRVGLSGSNSFFENLPNPVIVLEPGESQVITISYRPSREEKASGTVSIVHNATNVESPYVVALQGEALAKDKTFILEQNYPNPFNASTVIPFALAKDAMVSLDIYDAMGRHLQTLVNGPLSSGRYAERLDANEFSSGLYFYRIIVDGKSTTGKLMLTK